MTQRPSAKAASSSAREHAGRKKGLPSAIRRLRFNSSSLPRAERFERWQAAVGNLYQMSAPGHDGAGSLEVDTSVWNLGALMVSNNEFGSRFQRRTPKGIRSDQIDHYRLLMQTRGTLNIDADGHRESISAGRVMLTDLARPETYATEGGSNIVMFIPREMLDEALPRPLDLHGVALSGRCASMLADHLRALVTATSSLTLAEVPALNQATVSLLAASLAGSAQTLDLARPAVEVTLLRQACRYIDFHLTEPTLCAERICGFFKISRASLYRMFEPYGGVDRYVKERRLLRIHAVLASSTQRQHLGHLAEDYGFRTATHFSRVFREQFGYSPSEARHMKVGPQMREVHTERYGSFNGWLRELRD
jgi:AraC-like DNA-binding protein